MKKNNKTLLYFLAGFVIIILIAIGLNKFAEQKLKTEIEKTGSQLNLKYDKLDINLWRQNAEVTSPRLSLNGKDFKASRLSLNNIGFLAYLQNNKIEVGELILEAPEILINKSKANGDQNDSLSKFRERIRIKKLILKNGNIAVTENDSTNNLFFTNFKNLQLNGVELDSNSLKNTIPIKYESYEFDADSLFYKLDSRHHIRVGEFKIQEGNTVVRNFRIIPLYNKQEFQQHIPYEMDRFELQIEEINFSDLKWEFINDSLSIQNKLTEIKNAQLQVYRDKLQPKDTRQKKMYSEMLRDLPVKLKLDTIRLNNSYIKYEELMHADRSPGVVDFSNLHASLYNLTNKNLKAEDFPTTEIDVQTMFMQEAALNVNWKFNIQHQNDRFRISGNLNHISEEAMNRFMKPALNVLAKGAINDMKFNYSGNYTEATGEMKLIYNNFKVEVLRQDGTRKNKLLSALANLIMNNDAMSEDIYQKDLQVTRDKTRSFWNFLWKMVREGALKSFF